jgi:hypothetical protein
MRIDTALMPIQIRIGINMEIRVRMVIKTMPIHNTPLATKSKFDSIVKYSTPEGFELWRQRRQ